MIPGHCRPRAPGSGAAHPTDARAQVPLNNAVYHRLSTQQAVGKRGEVQLIIADNAVPDAYEHAFAQEEFSYSRPTISSVPHPGPAGVKTIHDN